MDKTNVIAHLNEHLRPESLYSTPSIGVPEVRHFLYKAKTAAQFTSPRYERPYLRPECQARLHRTYLKLQNSLHSLARPLKLMYRAEEHENVIAWVRDSLGIVTLELANYHRLHWNDFHLIFSVDTDVRTLRRVLADDLEVFCDRGHQPVTQVVQEGGEHALHPQCIHLLMSSHCRCHSRSCYFIRWILHCCFF